MRKLFPYILIVSIIVQLFAPFSVDLGTKNNLEVVSNKAEAEECEIISESLEPQILSVEKPRPEYVNYGIKTSGCEGNDLLVEIKSTGIFTIDVVLESGNQKITSNEIINFVFRTGEKTCDGGDCNKISFETSIKDQSGTIIASNIYQPYNTHNLEYKCDEETCSDDLPTQGAGWSMQSVSNKPNFGQINESTTLPVCSAAFWTTIGGCFGQLLYKALFQPTSYIFGLTGKILDITVMYSVNDESYRSAFVVEGWGLMRDFCNMFFIFVLLYIAFGTILGLHSVKTKEMIINVVIIGLLINFSLFATRLIIDASNILTRVFYNDNTISMTTKGPDGKPIPYNYKKDEGIPLSEAIVNNANPVELITRASNVNAIPVKSGDGDTTKDGVSAGTFILVVLLATAVNIVGMIAFLSSALIFIARVIGLWLAMILAPLAFFSYTVPALQGMKMIGWKNWWPETLKLAFLAPVFMFFMYLIIGFMNKGLDIINADNKTGLSFAVAIILPFIMIMVLLMKAKSIAQDMSGEMGQTITKGVATGGGLALGGAAVGTAMLGRNIIGKGLAAASRTKGAQERLKFNSSLDEWRTKDPKTRGAAPTWEDHAKKAGIKQWNPIASIGAKLNEKQKEVGKVDHARHVLDETTKAAGVVGADGEALGLKEMTGEDLNKVEKKFKETKRSEVESNVRKGFDAKGDILLEDTDTGLKHKGEEAFKAATRQAESNKIMGAVGSPERAAAIARGDVDAVSGELTNTGKEKLKDILNIKLNAAVKLATDNKLSENFSHIRDEASTHVNPLTRSFSRANKASYDIRKLSDIKSDKRESGVFSKVPIALIAGIATGVRAGIKNTGLSGGGIKVEGNFLKDLGNTISDSLKGMKVNVDLGHVGATKSSADAHGGGGHH